MRMSESLVLAAALAGLAAPASAINGATPTTAFEAVGRGIQITPEWVMVAAHYALGPTQTYTNGYGSWTVAASYFFDSAPWPQNDFALMRLVPNGSSVPYVSVSADYIPNGTFAPEVVTMASGANSGPARGYATSTISESALMADPDDAGPLQPVVVNWLLSYDTNVYVVGGDSGSALFAGQVSDTGLLLGVASAQLTNDAGTQAIGSAYVQPAAYRSWIDATMAADTTDSQVVHWVTAVAVPEPATWALGLGGAAVLLLGSRRGATRPDFRCKA